MSCVLEVEPTNDREDLSYSNLVIYHSGCDSVAGKVYRNPATNQYSIRCDCGFKLIFNEDGLGLSKIMETAISGEENTIDATWYYRNGCKSITVRQRNI